MNADPGRIHRPFRNSECAHAMPRSNRRSRADHRFRRVVSRFVILQRAPVTGSLWFHRIQSAQRRGFTARRTSGRTRRQSGHLTYVFPTGGSRVGVDSAEEDDASRPPRHCLGCPGRPARGRGTAGDNHAIGVLFPGSPAPSPCSTAFQQDSASSAMLRNRTSPSSTDSLSSGRNASPPSPPSWSTFNADAILKVNSPAPTLQKCDEQDSHRLCVGRHPTAGGLVASFARPGANVTGLTTFAPESAANGWSY